MLKKIFLLSAFFMLYFHYVSCFSQNKFCFLNDYQNLLCKKHQCGSNICSIDGRSCKQLKEWSSLMDKYVPHLGQKRMGEFFEFFSEIKECQMNDYIRLSTIVCSNKMKCDRKNQNFFRYMLALKPTECSCSNNKNNFNYNCGYNDYCSIDKYSCERLEFYYSKYDSNLESKIHKCS